MSILDNTQNPSAEVIAVYPNKIKIAIDDFSKFATVDQQLEKLRVGSYLEVADDDNHKLIVVINSYSIEYKEEQIDVEGEDRILKNKRYIIEANPLGTLINDKFQRGGDSLTIPPTKVKPARHEDILKVYQSNIKESEKFIFSKLLTDDHLDIPVNGNKFFNKHFSIVGSTGSGKSHTVSKVLQEAITAKNDGYVGLNNSHIIIFDIHGEYKSAFPEASYLDIENLVIPYWLLNSEELTELFIDTEANDHNQRSVFQEAVTANKKKHFKGDDNLKSKIHYDSPLFFEIKEVLQYLKYRNTEQKQKDNSIKWKADDGEFIFNDLNRERLFEDGLQVVSGSATGTLNAKFINFINRLEIKLNDRRLDFLLDSKAKSISFEDALKQFIGFSKTKTSNVTIIDLGGIPFEALSITVSLISRILFEFGFFFMKSNNDQYNCDTPLLLLYEEAHKYVPKSDLVKFRASRTAIERIAKEGRKYGVTLGIVSQRPSEISETIFSQCNSFVVMRLTNPDDQNYVKKLLPDTMGNMTDLLPTLKAGDALIVGESIVIPSLVHINPCSPEPKSSDIRYYEVWKDKWKNVDFQKIINQWEN